MMRITTNGVLKTYKSNLMNSFITLNSARNMVLTGRNFNSYAEDPASATQAFKLRRSFLRTDAQYSNSDTTIRKYESAYSSLESVVDSLNNQTSNSAWEAVLKGMNDATGEGRAALGKELIQLSDNIIQSMNTKYGDTFIFAGADGLNVPYEWKTDETTGEEYLTYRGVRVDSQPPELKITPGTGAPEVDANGEYILADGSGTISKTEYDKLKADYEKLQYMAEEEGTYVDLGFGLQENEDGELVTSSAFNSALQGINFLGYGKDADGDPKDIASMVRRMGQILSNCGEGGAWASTGEQEEFQRLAGKFEEACDNLQEKHVELSAQATFLKENQEQLKLNAYTLNEQINGLEQCDLADAITAFSWAQYCYNASLKVGNSILSQSLIDYMT